MLLFFKLDDETKMSKALKATRHNNIFLPLTSYNMRHPVTLMKNDPEYKRI